MPVKKVFLEINITSDKYTLLGPLMHFTLHANLKSGDVLHSIFAHGCTLWNYHIACLSLGIKLFLQNGTVYCMQDGSNFWDVLSKHKVAYAFLLASMVDKLEKMNAYPGKKANNNSDKRISLF
ncbi:UNVERIFIED_CONTAM: hypothetical protein NCL1_39338 [Trichonephila clavipes]